MPKLLLLLVTAELWAATPDGFVRIPAADQVANDALTGVKLRVEVREFLIDPAETTQAEFERVMRFNPSHFKGANRPVENVSWWDAIRYANARSANEGLTPCYNLTTGACDRARNGYRLPTEAEWTQAVGADQLPSGDALAKAALLGGRQTKDTRALAPLFAKGTAPVRSLAPNRHGLYDMLGNVWEWCDDWYSAAGGQWSAEEPAGPVSGTQRVLRGGSFMSNVAQWSHSYRSSMTPDHRSPYTGFRLCRTSSAPQKPFQPDAAWWGRYNAVPEALKGSTGDLSDLLAGARTQAVWQQRAASIRDKWMRVLGVPALKPATPAVRLIETFQEPGFEGRLMEVQVEPDHWERIYILLPANMGSRPRPAVIVPYYDVDTPVGSDSGGRRFTPLSVRSFAYLAARQGQVAVAVRWFGESYGEGYSEAVANLARRHPGVTGLGKWVWDAQRVLDYVVTLPMVDRDRIGMIGHSLGGKMTLYAAALDPRIKVAVASEPGIGLGFSNYEDFWYLGERIRELPAGGDQHELLALIAPRPFLLIAGESSDKDKSWTYINAARKVYDVFGQPRAIGAFNHRTGHSPTPESGQFAMEWLAYWLGEAGDATIRR
ncbi:MAG TPA: SUMF1/EgtB/PvdO family nonheme iron enzyme [Bryobacteraceae bacterium]|nr:SUMF1/EgtB/PvdO family nonheme iron enzyme [Bryobacteraceae bacterium]